MEIYKYGIGDPLGAEMFIHSLCNCLDRLDAPTLKSEPQHVFDDIVGWWVTHCLVLYSSNATTLRIIISVMRYCLENISANEISQNVLQF